MAPIFSEAAPAFGRCRLPVLGNRSGCHLAGGEACCPAISRSGNRLAYERGVFDANIWRLSLSGLGAATGPPARFIASTRGDYAPQYSPDGKRIAFESDRSGVYGIWVSDADGSNAVELISRAGASCGTASWSPDGQRIAFNFDAEGNIGYLCHSGEWRKAHPPDHRSRGRRGPKLVERWQVGLLCIESDRSIGGVEGIGRRRGGCPGDPERRRDGLRVTRRQVHLLHERRLCQELFGRCR